MWVYDLATLRFLDVNNAAVRRYGYARDEFLAMRITDIRPPEDIPNIPRLLATISRPRAAFEEAGVWWHRLKSGEIADVQITSHALTFNGRAAVLLEEHAPSLSPDVQRYLRIVRENVCRMRTLIDDLLMFSKLSRQPLKVMRVVPGELVRRALEDLAAEQEGRQVQMRIGDLPDCDADPALLKQVFVNQPPVA